MEYLWTEDTGAGLHFWKIVNRLFYNNRWIVESKGSNQGVLDAVEQLVPKEGDTYYIAFDYVVDNQDVRNKYRLLRSCAQKYKDQIVLLDMLCFEYLILAIDHLVEWTGTGKQDKIQMRENILEAIEHHKINIEMIRDEKTIQYIKSFQRFSTERLLKALVGELTQNEKWSVKGTEMGECWYKDCCVTDHQERLHCGKPSSGAGDEKMRCLIGSEAVQRVLRGTVTGCPSQVFCR